MRSQALAPLLLALFAAYYGCAGQSDDDDSEASGSAGSTSIKAGSGGGSTSSSSGSGGSSTSSGGGDLGGSGGSGGSSDSSTGGSSSTSDASSSTTGDAAINTGACDVFKQDCSGGLKCSFHCKDNGWICEANPSSGSSEHGASCPGTQDGCAKGLLCLGDNNGGYVCKKACMVDSDCPSGHTCQDASIGCADAGAYATRVCSI